MSGWCRRGNPHADLARGEGMDAEALTPQLTDVRLVFHHDSCP